MAIPTIVQLPLFPAEKRCTRCSEPKPLEAFHHSRASRDGRHYVCRDCQAAYHTRYYAAHATEIKAKVKAWNDAHRERARARRRRWVVKNRQYNHAYYASHKAEIDRVAQQWRAANRDHIRARQRAYAQLHPHYQHASWSLRNARLRNAPGRHTATDVKAMEALQAGLCAYCRQPYGRYHIDHKQPVSRGGSNGPENLCLACARCNHRKCNKTEAEFRALLAASGA